MAENKKLRKALDTIALNHSKGVVSNDILIKACETYKQRIGFEEDFDYDMIVAKSVFDAINGIEADEELCKAIVPGQTKIVDGVMYIYTATPNAKTQYDWRVVRKGKKGTKPVGKSGKLTDKEVDAAQKMVNELFPKDLSTLKVIKKLGGSTGAELVEDIHGNQYVKKKGSNTNNDHVKSEYLANQMYAALGIKTPDYELYEENGEQILLSRFIPMAKPTTSNDNAEMAKGWIADIVLANWDVYENDNCLIDSAGRVIRVDNGGCLNYRAQGKKKPFDDDVVKTYEDMKRYNSGVFTQLNDNDILQQIADIRAHKSDIVDFLIESGQDVLATTIGNRIDNLSKIESDIKKKQRANQPNLTPRQLKSPTDMYRDFTDDELQDFWDNAQGSSGRAKLQHTDTLGWDLLSTICKARGFDVRPRLVDDTEYWKHVASLPSDMPMMMRGVANRGGTSAQTYAHMFKHDDDCFYGNIGIYGEGIYAHVNDGKTQNQTRTGYTSSRAYKDAVSYANYNTDGVILLAYEKGAKIAKTSDLIDELKRNPPIAANTTALQKELDKIKVDLDTAEDTLRNLSTNTENQVKSTMHYDEQGVHDLHTAIDTTDWSALDDNGEPDIPSWHDFVEVQMSDAIKANGGTVTPEHGQLTFKLPNSRVTFTITQNQYERPNAIKRKNAFSPSYHYPIERLREWFEREHVSKVDAAVKEAIDNLGDSITKLKGQISQLQKQYSDKKDEIKKKSCPDPDGSLMEAIYDSVVNRGSMEPLGIYAALKGYDGLYQPNGNGSDHGYAIILNRSKLVVKK